MIDETKYSFRDDVLAETIEDFRNRHFNILDVEFTSSIKHQVRTFRDLINKVGGNSYITNLDDIQDIIHFIQKLPNKLDSALEELEGILAQSSSRFELVASDIQTANQTETKLLEEIESFKEQLQEEIKINTAMMSAHDNVQVLIENARLKGVAEAKKDLQEDIDLIKKEIMKKIVKEPVIKKPKI